MAGINGWEFILLALIAVFILGPDRLPEYAAKLARGIRKLRVMAEGAKDQLRDQLGPEYEDINWRQYDPRQYDPRRIVREALIEPLDDAVAPVRDEISSVRSAATLRGGETAGAEPADDAGHPVAVAEPAGAGAAVAAAASLGSLRPSGGVDGDTALAARTSPQAFDAARPVPYDVEAT
ncbi:twin-arginine translocase TatA/TatE family subunit [uncultured Phycicoccus sp.]|uniref:twin-arginine translocase TatA/TatE family subunit n=1 Tax=uncultured Phycicoccus sp. TaxID=661422 RepID=UPI002620D235|nr:twin-arginine translocase TatA/TatE family subunit [uncultured Phycicoccus sp.]